MSTRVQVLEERTGDLQRQLMLAQSDLKAAREDAHIHELDKAQLQAQLTGDSILAAAFTVCIPCLGYDTKAVQSQQDSCNAMQLPKQHLYQGTHLGLGSVFFCLTLVFLPQLCMGRYIMY